MLNECMQICYQLNDILFDSIQMVDIAATAMPHQLLYGVEILKATICVMLVDFILR